MFNCKHTKLSIFKKTNHLDSMMHQWYLVRTKMTMYLSIHKEKATTAISNIIFLINGITNKSLACFNCLQMYSWVSSFFIILRAYFHNRNRVLSILHCTTLVLNSVAQNKKNDHNFIKFDLPSVSMNEYNVYCVVLACITYKIG